MGIRQRATRTVLVPLRLKPSTTIRSRPFSSQTSQLRANDPQQRDSSANALLDVISEAPSQPSASPSQYADSTQERSAGRKGVSELARNFASSLRPRTNNAADPFSSRFNVNARPGSSGASIFETTRERLGEAERFARLEKIERAQKRQWALGDVYAPHDLTAAESKKFMRRGQPDRDVFDMLGMDASKEWKNFNMMYEFQTTMGRIKKRSETGLRPKNQRKIARAIRRGIGMGFLPSVHAHPEILRRSGI